MSACLCNIYNTSITDVLLKLQIYDKVDGGLRPSPLRNRVTGRVRYTVVGPGLRGKEDCTMFVPRLNSYLGNGRPVQ